jgi:hypothetical protein
VKHILVLSLLLLSVGCNTPSLTIRDLGHPAFEEVVGAETLFARPALDQRLGLDAFTSDVDEGANHKFVVSFWPTANKDKIGLQVRAAGVGHLELAKLAVAAFPVTRQQALRFEAIGELPDPLHPIAVSTKTERDENGGATLYLFFERSAIPAGTEWLAIPTLAQFKDGWIHIRFYETAIPTPMTLPPGTAGEAPATSDDAPTGSK